VIWRKREARTITKLRKAHLRECARKALETRGYRVEDIGGAGVVPGARLRISKGPKAFRVAVRTSLERKVGFARNPDGGWMTLPDFRQIVVVTPSAEHPNCAEVLGFKREDLITAFDASLAARKKRNPEFSPSAPIFLPLDSHQRGEVTKPGLKELSTWEVDVPLASVASPQSPNREGMKQFVDRIKREFAELYGAEEKDVDIQIQIKR